MKTCNSSRVIYHNPHPHHHHHHQQEHIIRNVPTRLEDDSSSITTTTVTGRKREGCRKSSSNQTNTTFRLRNSSLIVQSFIFCLVLSSTLHTTRGSHLPTSYLVQKSNSNINSNDGHTQTHTTSNADSEVEPLSSTTTTTALPVDLIASTTETFTGLPQPEASDNSTTASSSNDTLPLSTQSSTELPTPTSASLEPLNTTTSTTQSTPTKLLNSYEDNNDSYLNYISEHDHYDEYAAMKAVLDKEKSTEEIKPSEVESKKGERHPYLLQAADGRKYASIEAQCDNRQVTISGFFDDIFKGRIYALGYSDEEECGANNAKANSHNITFSLPLGSCGVQMLTVDDNLENDLRHEVTLYIQYSAFLQQVVDEKISVSCTEVKKATSEESSNEEVPVVSSRQGRRMGGMGDPGKYGSTKISSRIGESWMEILAGKDPSPKSRKLQPVSVGEDVTLVISTKVLRGYDARIVNCSAHDGSRAGSIDGSRAQQILDSAGCSLDRSLVPNLRRRRLPIESRNRLITLHFATFQAFKFPERDHLHIKCAVAYCQGPCPQEPCDSVMNHFGSWKDKYGRIADVLIDSTEVVNSVEVIAPELDDLGRKENRGQQHERQPAVSSSGSYLSLSSGNNVSPALPSEISGRQFPSDQTSSYSSYSNSNNNGGSASAAPSVAASAGQSMFGNSQGSLHQPEILGHVGNSVCVSPGTVILALVILGVVLVISATATLWFALKRSEAKKYRHVKHSPFQQHGPQPYYRFSHW